jgi:hypothetical protein
MISNDGALRAELAQSQESIEAALGASEWGSIGSNHLAALRKSSVAGYAAASAAAAAVDDVEAQVAAAQGGVLDAGDLAGIKKRKRNHEDEESIRAVCKSWDGIKDDEAWHKQKLIELLAARAMSACNNVQEAQSDPIYSTSAIDAAAMAHQPPSLLTDTTHLTQGSVSPGEVMHNEVVGLVQVGIDVGAVGGGGGVGTIGAVGTIDAVGGDVDGGIGEVLATSEAAAAVPMEYPPIAPAVSLPGAMPSVLR